MRIVAGWLAITNMLLCYVIINDKTQSVERRFLLHFYNIHTRDHV